jgi:putative DNA primase/helicase
MKIDSTQTNNLHPDDLDDHKTQNDFDVIQAEFGPLLLIEDKRVGLNQPAIAAGYAKIERVAYSALNRAHYRYNTAEGVWEIQSQQEAIRGVSAFLKRIGDEHKVPHIVAKRTQALAKSILQFVEGISLLKAPPAPELMLVPAKNGVIDLSGAKPTIHPYRADHWFTHKLPWAFNPDAKCERFLNELISPALPDGDDVELLQRDLGRQLLPGNRAQTLSALIGDGGSGKSVLVSIHERIIGIEKVAHLRSDKLMGRFETHALQGKSLAVGKDVQPDYLNNAGAAMIKSLTGADRIETEQKYGGKFHMRGTLYVIITANSRLLIRLQNDASAWRRRLVVYVFSRKPPADCVPNFDEVLLRDEGEGILNWYVEGAMKHLAELNTNGRLALTAKQQRRVDDLLMESDAQREFLRANVVKGAGTLSVEEIWQAYSAFARERGWHIPSKQVFCTDLAESMFHLFGEERDNHIMRQASTVRGYRNVLFVAAT